jgi:glycosyltransferase involved in cell wall biosynthesis
MNEAAPLILHVFPSFAVGGAQIRFASMANRFGRNWRHVVVALDGNTECRSRLDSALDVRFLTEFCRDSPLLARLYQIQRILRAARPALLVTSNWGAIEWAIANMLPFIRHVHTEDGFGPEETLRQLPRRVWARRMALQRSTVILPSRTLLKIASETWRLNPSRLKYIPNGVDLSRFAAPTTVRTAVGGPLVIGTIAALRPEKNLSRLLRAFKRATESEGSVSATLVIAGDGAERSVLEALAVSLKIADRVTFLGHVEQPQVVYSRFDIFALSSDTEQMPLSVLEAMAVGLPIAAANVGDVAAMVAEPNAAFIVAKEVDALSAALKALLLNPDLRQSLGRANRVKAEREFNEETMFQCYNAIWQGTSS